MNSVPQKTFNQKVALINKAKTPLGVDLEELKAALTTQLDRDFTPVWGYSASLRVADAATSEEWQVVFLDNADAASTEGYHNITANGQPLSKVFVKSIAQAGEKLSATASHELLEMLIDPGAQMWAQNSDGLFYAYEMCDAVEEVTYPIGGIEVSDFVYPSFFESWHKPNAVKFDHENKVSRPFQTLQNGYQVVSNGAAAREIFGSRRKQRHFMDFEDRSMHRSEYRKARVGGGRSRGQRSASGAVATHSAALRYTAKYLQSLSEQCDHSNSGRNSAFIGDRARDDDPFCGFELPSLGQSNSVANFARRAPPFRDDDPTNGFDLF